MTGYRFSQRVADAFRTGRVFLAGDAAHVMSPVRRARPELRRRRCREPGLEARLRARGDAPEALLDTYDAERRPAALDNLAATDATMRFLAPARVAAPRVARPRAALGSPLRMVPRRRRLGPPGRAGGLRGLGGRRARPRRTGLPRHGTVGARRRPARWRPPAGPHRTWVPARRARSSCRGRAMPTRRSSVAAPSTATMELAGAAGRLLAGSAAPRMDRSDHLVRARPPSAASRYDARWSRTRGGTRPKAKADEPEADEERGDPSRCRRRQAAAPYRADRPRGRPRRRLRRHCRGGSGGRGGCGWRARCRGGHCRCCIGATGHHGDGGAACRRGNCTRTYRSPAPGT